MLALSRDSLRDVGNGLVLTGVGTDANVSFVATKPDARRRGSRPR
jgi:hypothetical protein